MVCQLAAPVPGCSPASSSRCSGITAAHGFASFRWPGLLIPHSFGGPKWVAIPWPGLALHLDCGRCACVTANGSRRHVESVQVSITPMRQSPPQPSANRGHAPTVCLLPALSSSAARSDDARHLRRTDHLRTPTGFIVSSPTARMPAQTFARRGASRARDLLTAVTAHNVPEGGLPARREVVAIWQQLNSVCGQGGSRPAVIDASHSCTNSPVDTASVHSC